MTEDERLVLVAEGGGQSSTFSSAAGATLRGFHGQKSDPLKPLEEGNKHVV